jgi:hypothetical protein
MSQMIKAKIKATNSDLADKAASDLGMKKEGSTGQVIFRGNRGWIRVYGDGTIEYDNMYTETFNNFVNRYIFHALAQRAEELGYSVDIVGNTLKIITPQGGVVEVNGSEIKAECFPGQQCADVVDQLLENTGVQVAEREIIPGITPGKVMNRVDEG